MIEEHMFTADEKGIAHHRFEVSRNISKLKAMDIDLHLTVLVSILISGYTFYSIIQLLL